MVIVRLAHIHYSYATRRVLEDVSLEVTSGAKIGLVGPNGAGKSTLLQIIAGALVPDSGSFFQQPGTHVGYLAQTPDLFPTHTVWEEMLRAAPELMRIQQELRRLENRLAQPDVYGEQTALDRTLDAMARQQARFDQLDGYRFESLARKALQTLGLPESSLNLPISALSGGQKKLVGLAKLLVKPVDLLLLDEPDNHLDLEGKAYLERFIRAFAGAIVIVSHDRYLLDETVGQIIEIEDLRLTLHQGNYSAYVVAKELAQLRQQQMFEAQQKEIARIESAIARFEYWASIVVNERHARQARSRKKTLDRMDKVERPVMERRRMGLELEGWRGSNKVLEIRDLVKTFFDIDHGEQVILSRLDLLVWHGERVGLLGPNGAGKSVLLRCILGQEEPTSGLIKVGPSVKIGYYAQEHETLDPNKTLIQEIRQTKPMYERDAVRFLGRFLFTYHMCRQRVSDLSGGERSRLQLAKLMLSGVNFLLLDEPTNNLDLASCEVLESVLEEFEGTALVISHDRYFLDQVVERIVELDSGALTAYPGNYTYYRRQKEKAVCRINGSQLAPSPGT